jgi:transposase-like protein
MKFNDCPKCGENNWIKKGKDSNKKQRYKCKNCGHRPVSTKVVINKDSVKLPNILILDIETSPVRAYVWSLWKQNVGLSQIISNWFMLTWSAKWLFSSEVYADKLTGEEALEEDDKRICKSLWKLLDQADIVIAHNGDRFDIPKINSRFVLNGLTPPSPYQRIDTLKIARKTFGFSSNRLDALATQFGFDNKLDTDFSLWNRCMHGDDDALAYMEKYNKYDVELLEEVYIKLRPWMKSHPSVALFGDMKEKSCTCCGSVNLTQAGEYVTSVSVFKTYRCNDCGAFSRERLNSVTVKQKRNLLISVAR